MDKLGSLGLPVGTASGRVSPPLDPGDVRTRYRNDPAFAALVNQIRGFIHRVEYTPSELREAVMLAAILEEMEKPLGQFYLQRLEDELDMAVGRRRRDG